jgi:hypothetical protein
MNSVLEIHGQIPFYKFGKIKCKYADEFDEFIISIDQEIRVDLGYIISNIDTVSKFLKYFVKLVSRGIDPLETFWKVISQEKLKTFPNIYELINDVIKNRKPIQYFLYNLLDFPNLEYLIDDGILFFEHDSKITLKQNQEIVFEDMPLSEFVKTHAVFEQLEINTKIQNFQKLNQDLNVTSINSLIENKFHCQFVNAKMSPQSLVQFCEDSSACFQISIYRDEHVIWRFYFDNEQVELNKLFFVKFTNAKKFRNSKYDTAFNFLFYKNEFIIPEREFLKGNIFIDVGRFPENPNALEFLLK